MSDHRCPACGGKAVLVRQTGELNCVRQCRETAVSMARRNVLQQTTVTTVREVASRVPKGMGFAVILFDFGSGGNISYASNADRTAMRSALRELLDKWDAEVGS